MINKDKIEKSLLLCAVQSKSWDLLIKNNITRDCFSPANYGLYDYINKFTSEGNYPEIRVVANLFDIQDYQVSEYLAVVNSVEEMCDVVRKEYVKNQLEYRVKQLNEYVGEMENDPVRYIDRLANTVEDLKKIGYHTKSVGMFDNIEGFLDINRDDVISTGFRELDKDLYGWKRGEDLIVFVGRTGQGKSWICLKFAMAAALAGERVGVYSGEMSQLQLQERMLCCAKQSPTDTAEEALKFIKDSNIDIRLLTQKELRRKATVRDIEEFIIRDNLSIVVIDQLSLMDDITSKPRNSVATNIW